MAISAPVQPETSLPGKQAEAAEPNLEIRAAKTAEQAKQEATRLQQDIQRAHERLAAIGIELAELQVSPTTLEKFQALNQESQHVLNQARQRTQRLLETIGADDQEHLQTYLQAAEKNVAASHYIDRAADRALEKAAKREQQQREEEGFADSADEAQAAASMHQEDGDDFADEAPDGESVDSQPEQTEPTVVASSSPETTEPMSAETTPEAPTIAIKQVEEIFLNLREEMKMTEPDPERLQRIESRLAQKRKELAALLPQDLREAGAGDIKAAFEDELQRMKTRLIEIVATLKNPQVAERLRSFIFDSMNNELYASRSPQDQYDLMMYFIDMIEQGIREEQGEAYDTGMAIRMSDPQRKKEMAAEIKRLKSASEAIQKKARDMQNILQLKTETDAAAQAVETLGKHATTHSRRKQLLGAAEDAYLQYKQLADARATFAKKLPDDGSIPDELREQYEGMTEVVAQAERDFVAAVEAVTGRKFETQALAPRVESPATAPEAESAPAPVESTKTEIPAQQHESELLADWDKMNAREITYLLSDVFDDVPSAQTIDEYIHATFKPAVEMQLWKLDDLKEDLESGSRRPADILTDREEVLKQFGQMIRDPKMRSEKLRAEETAFQNIKTEMVKTWDGEITGEITNLVKKFHRDFDPGEDVNNYLKRTFTLPAFTKMQQMQNELTLLKQAVENADEPTFYNLLNERERLMREIDQLLRKPDNQQPVVTREEAEDELAFGERRRLATRRWDNEVMEQINAHLRQQFPGARPLRSVLEAYNMIPKSDHPLLQEMLMNLRNQALRAENQRDLEDILSVRDKRVQDLKQILTDQFMKAETLDAEETAKKEAGFDLSKLDLGVFGEFGTYDKATEKEREHLFALLNDIGTPQKLDLLSDTKKQEIVAAAKAIYDKAIREKQLFNYDDKPLDNREEFTSLSNIVSSLGLQKFLAESEFDVQEEPETNGTTQAPPLRKAA